MQCRHNALLQVFVLLITGVQFAASQSAATLTIPTLATSVTSFESIITSTLDGTVQGGARAGSATDQEDEITLSTTTEESTISISTETVLVTTVSPNTVYITTSGEAETAPTQSAIVPTSSAAAAGDVSTLVSSTSPIPDDDGSKSGNQGLSAGAKAGIAVGSILGAALLAGMAYFCLKARSEGRPRSNTLGPDRQSTAGGNGSTLAASEKQPEGPQPDSSPEQMTHPAYAANRLSDHMNLTGIVYEDKDESPMYIGVPSHLNGGKRWSVQALDRS